MAEPDAEARIFGDSRSREAFRRQKTAEQPRWYSPWAHLAATLGIGTGAMLLAVLEMRGLRAVELLTVPVMLFLANLAEWRLHKQLLHRRRRLLHQLYDQHTPMHHRIFRYGDMSVRSARELGFVLMPALGVAGIVLTAAPFAALAGWLITPNVGYLTLFASAFYVTSYEVTHLCYHLPESALVYRVGLVRWLREHHARHHDPRLMQLWNFNVTLPLGDWLFKTVAPRELVERIRSAPAARPPSAEPAVHDA